jgi:hypothetical protein
MRVSISEIEVTVMEESSAVLAPTHPHASLRTTTLFINLHGSSLGLVSGRAGVDDFLLSLRVANASIEEQHGASARIPIIGSAVEDDGMEGAMIRLGFQRTGTTSPSAPSISSLALDLDGLKLHHRVFLPEKHWVSRLSNVFAASTGSDDKTPDAKPLPSLSRINIHLLNSFVQYAPLYLKSALALEVEDLKFSTTSSSSSTESVLSLVFVNASLYLLHNRVSINDINKVYIGDLRSKFAGVLHDSMIKLAITIRDNDVLPATNIQIENRKLALLGQIDSISVLTQTISNLVNEEDLHGAIDEDVEPPTQDDLQAVQERIGFKVTKAQVFQGHTAFRFVDPAVAIKSSSVGHSVYLPARSVLFLGESRCDSVNSEQSQSSSIDMQKSKLDKSMYFSIHEPSLSTADRRQPLADIADSPPKDDNINEIESPKSGKQVTIQDLSVVPITESVVDIDTTARGDDFIHPIDEDYPSPPGGISSDEEDGGSLSLSRSGPASAFTSSMAFSPQQNSLPDDASMRSRPIRVASSGSVSSLAHAPDQSSSLPVRIASSSSINSMSKTPDKTAALPVRIASSSSMSSMAKTPDMHAVSAVKNTTPSSEAMSVAMTDDSRVSGASFASTRMKKKVVWQTAEDREIAMLIAMNTPSQKQGSSKQSTPGSRYDREANPFSMSVESSMTSSMATSIETAPRPRKPSADSAAPRPTETVKISSNASGNFITSSPHSLRRDSSGRLREASEGSVRIVDQEKSSVDRHHFDIANKSLDRTARYVLVRVYF